MKWKHVSFVSTMLHSFNWIIASEFRQKYKKRFKEIREKIWRNLFHKILVLFNAHCASNASLIIQLAGTVCELLKFEENWRSLAICADSFNVHINSQ